MEYLIKNNLIIYTDDPIGHNVKLPDGSYGDAPVYGTALAKSSLRIRLTSLIWDHYGFNNDTLLQKIDYDIVHEAHHDVIANTGHPLGFERAINNMGYYNPARPSFMEAF